MTNATKIIEAIDKEISNLLNASNELPFEYKSGQLNALIWVRNTIIISDNLYATYHLKVLYQSGKLLFVCEDF